MDESRARALLLAERAEVETLLRDEERDTETEREAEVSEEPKDFGDAAEPLTEEANTEAVTAELLERLAAIDRALARLEAGTYGRSVLSGKPIPDERLEADPAAELLVEEASAQR